MTGESPARKARSAIRTAVELTGTEPTDWDKIARRLTTAHLLVTGGEPLAADQTLSSQIGQARILAWEHNATAMRSFAARALNRLDQIITTEIPESGGTGCMRCQAAAARYIRITGNGPGISLLCVACLGSDCQTMTAEQALTGVWKLEQPAIHEILAHARTRKDSTA